MALQIMSMLLGARGAAPAAELDAATRRQALLRFLYRIEQRLESDKPLILVGEDIHWAGVWRDYTTDKGPGDPGPGGGGSLLGAPRYADEFRRYLEDSPFATEIAEYEGQRDRVPHYKFPLRAALAELAGRGKATDEYPFMARVLYRTALRDGDWDGACASFGILAPIRRVYIEAALYRLWCRYSVEPPAEWQQRGVA